MEEKKHCEHCDRIVGGEGQKRMHDKLKHSVKVRRIREEGEEKEEERMKEKEKKN